MSANSSDVGELDTDIIMRALAKKMLRMLVDDEYNDKNLCVFFSEKPDNDMIGVTIGISVGDLIVEKGAAETVDVAKKPIEEPIKSESTEEKPSMIGVKERISSATRKLRGVISDLTRKKEKQPEQSLPEEINSTGNPFRPLNNRNSIGNPFAGKPANIPVIMPSVEEGVATANQATKKTIQQRRQEFRTELEAKYGRPFSEIKLANIQKNADRRKYIQFLEESKRIRKADALRPVAESILAKISPGPRRTELETALLAIEEEPTETELHALEQLIELLRSTIAPEEQTKVAFRPELIRKAKNIADKMKTVIDGTVNIAAKKTLEDKLLLLESLIITGNDEEIDQKHADQLNMLITFFEKKYPDIVTQAPKVMTAVKSTLLRRATLPGGNNSIAQPPSKSQLGTSNRTILGNLGPKQTRKQNPLSGMVTAALKEQEEE